MNVFAKLCRVAALFALILVGHVMAGAIGPELEALVIEPWVNEDPPANEAIPSDNETYYLCAFKAVDAGANGNADSFSCEPLQQ